MKLDGIIYDRWGCAESVKQVAFPLAFEISSSHIGGIRIRAIWREYPNWFVGLSLAVDRWLSKDNRRHSRLVYVNGFDIDIEAIRKNFTELRHYLIEPYQEVDFIWEQTRTAYW